MRFNNTEDIKEKLVEIGAYVFFAPKKEDITSYVFVDELQKYVILIIFLYLLEFNVNNFLVLDVLVEISQCAFARGGKKK